MREIRIKKEEAKQRLDKYLIRYLNKASVGFIYKMLRKKNITLNRKKAKGRELLEEGDLICMFLAEDTILKFQQSASSKDFPVSKSLKIIYEDDQILAVNKPAGMLSQKADQSDVSANDYILGYLIQSGQKRPEDFLSFRPGISNRLDRNTSGILLASKTLPAARLLSEMIKQHDLDKYYLTVVHGSMITTGLISAYIKKDSDTNKVSIKSYKFEGSHKIETAYTALNSHNNLTFLKVHLITGKTHQIRSHLAFLGHPVIGDTKYGSKKESKYYRRTYGLKHQLLHAYRIYFPKKKEVPADLAGLCIEAPLPELFTRILVDNGLTNTSAESYIRRKDQ